MLEARIGLLIDELDSLKRKEPTACNTEVVSRKVVDENSDGNDLVDGIRRRTIVSCVSFQHDVNHLLVAICRSLKKLFGCDARALQQGVCDAIRGTAEEVLKLFVGAPKVVNSISTYIVGHAKHDELARPRAFFSASCNLCVTT